jgi:putative DNA primase/helicase
VTEVQRAGALFAVQHVELLASAAIDPDYAFGQGVRSATSADDLPRDVPQFWAALLPGLLFPWRDETGHVEWQLRPDVPRAFEAGGEPAKYLLRSREQGFRSTQWVLRKPAGGQPVLFVEGTKQALAAAQHAPEGMGVVGLVGCWGGSDRGLPARGLAIADGRDVFVCLDADYTVNPKVWDAGERLTRALAVEGARAVRFVRLPAGGKAGLDDVLAGRDADGRRTYLSRLMQDAEAERFAKSNRPRKPRAEVAGALFDPVEGLKTQSAARALLGQFPMALTNESGGIAVYRDGVYRTQGGEALAAACAALFGDAHRASYVSSIRHSLLAELDGQRIPDRTTSPLLNLANGLLDMTTGQLHPHSPEHFSLTQFAVPFDPAATCPTYDRWIVDVVGEDQVPVLEECVAAVLDPRVTPSKALMLFGPSRSGKSTMLRLLQAIVGADNCSAVTLHDLADNRFAAADLYGKVLNVAADLSSKDVSDVSALKVLTGDDPIRAERKNGQPFTFRNKALFAFSANTLPSVNEASRAYSERVTPVKFGRSFAGAEDPALELAMMTELPGIFVRLVKAYVARTVRKQPTGAVAAVRDEFDQASNSVVQFVRQACRTLPPVAELAPQGCATTTQLYLSYQSFMSATGRKAFLGKTKFAQVLREGLADVRELRDPAKRRVWNLITLPPDQWESTEG